MNGSSDIVCRDYVKGYCRFEGNCKFKHEKGSGASDRKVDTLCKDYARGHCDFGAHCRFSHPTVCKDFLAGKCTYMKCKFFHPSTGGPPGGPAGGPGPRGPPGGMKRPMDNSFDDLPPEYCRDFVYGGVCRRPRCSYLHEMPNKRRAPDGPPFQGPGPQGPGPQGPPPPGNAGWNDGPGGPGGPGYVSAEVKAYVSQLELKLTMYEEKIRDLEKRCEQYEDFNKLLTERNDELKSKLGLGGPGGYQQQQGGNNSGGGGGYQTGSTGGYQTGSRNTSRPGGYYN